MGGAQRLPVQVFVPIVFAMSTSLQYFQSMFIFGEFSSVDLRTAFLSISGAVLSLAGALFIQPPMFSEMTADVQGSSPGMAQGSLPLTSVRSGQASSDGTTV